MAGLGLRVAVAVTLASSGLAHAASAKQRYSRAKEVPGQRELVKFVAAKGEHARLQISVINGHCVPGKSRDLNGINRCLVITDTGSLIGYEYHATTTLGFTQFDYGCYNRAGPHPGHQVICPLDYLPSGPPDDLEVDLRRAASSIVTFVPTTLNHAQLHAARVDGSPGPDTFQGVVAAHEALLGHRGDDTFVMTPGAKVLVRGGPGSDTLDYSGFGHGVTVDLARFSPKLSIENVIGTPFDDKLIGNGAANHLSGGGGNDLLVGGRGADTLSGGPGMDTVSYAGDPRNVNVTLDGLPNDGEPGEHDNVGGDVETIVGGDGNDQLTGDDAPHTLIGGPGDDVLTGGNSDDRLIGGAGNDTLRGGEGNDVLTGGPDNDSFSCGAGADDRVTDWHAGDQVAADCNRPHIYWANNANGTIGVATLDGTEVLQTLISGAENPTSVVADTDHLYWSNAGNGTIGRADLDGRQVDQHFIGSGAGTGLAVDGQHIYWTNQNTGAVERADLDGGSVDASFITGANDPIGVAVDGSHVYWTNTADGTIGRARLDGTHVDQSFIRVGGSPLGLALDTNTLYWADAAANAVDSVAITGGAAGTLLSGLASPRALTVEGGLLYWGNFGANAVGRATVTGASASPSFIGGGDGVIGVAVSPPGFVSFP